MNNLDNPLCFVAYAAGFANGAFIGLHLSERLSIGKVMVRVITRKDAPDLVEHLQEMRIPFTAIDAMGAHGPVKILFMVVNSREVSAVTGVVRQFNSKAFYSVEDVRKVSEEETPHRSLHMHGLILPFRIGRKGK